MHFTGRCLVKISLMIIVGIGMSFFINNSSADAQIRSPAEQSQITNWQVDATALQASLKYERSKLRPVKLKMQFHPKLLRSWWVAPKSQINRRLMTLIWS